MEYKCAKEGCRAAFATPKELHRHCNREDDHDYCKKCRFLAKDWDDLTAHKVSSPLAHICCKFCGEDFKTPSGRDRHVKQLHPVDQDLRCIGCDERFTRAAALCEHLEFDYCRVISAQQFKSNLQHKAIITKLLTDPDAAQAKLNDWNDAAKDSDVGGGIRLDGCSTQNGSSNLLDDDDEGGTPLEGMSGGSIAKPLIPETKPRNPNAPRLGERWPALPGGKKEPSVSDVSNDMADISLGRSSHAASRVGGVPLHLSANTPYAAAASSRVPSMTNPSAPSSPTTEKPGQNGTVPSTTNKSSAWEGSVNASGVLFKGMEKTPVDDRWAAALKARDEDYERENSNNMFRMRFWDPTHKDYDPERFFNPVIEKYSCPLPQCEELFQEPFMLEHHIMTTHAISQIRCPQCLKLFGSTTALVAHCEAPTSSCGISRTDRFGQAIDMFSGGFIGATDARRPDITDADRKDRPDKHGEIVKDSGIKFGYTKYESTLPLDWPTNGFQQEPKVNVGRTWDDGGRGPNRRGRTPNPAVPLSGSHKQQHSTKSIYPQPFQDFNPPKSYVEKASRPQRKVQQGGNWAGDLVDPDAFLAKKDRLFEELPARVFHRDDIHYSTDDVPASSHALKSPFGWK